VEINITDKFKFNGILDSGSEVNLISEEVYDKLIRAGVQVPVLPVENVVLVTAFGKKSRRIRQQVLVEFTMGSDAFEGVFMVSPQLRNDAIIGCHFLQDYGICIDFSRGVVSYVRNDIVKEQTFVTEARIRNEKGESKQTRVEFLLKDPSTGQQPQHTPADCNDQVLSRTVHSCSKSFSHHTGQAAQERTGSFRDGGNLSCSESHCRTSESEGSGSLEYDAACSHLNKVDVMPDSEVSEVLCIQSQGSVESNAVDELKFRQRYVRRGMQAGESVPRPSSYPEDPRSLHRTDVSALVGRTTSLSELQQRTLYEILIKYIDHLTTKPGKCNLLKYKFQVNTDKPIVGYSRPIPFALRPAVREQINEMLKDDILEVSASPTLNPLTIIRKEDGKIRICLDARKVNQFTVQDHERVPPIQELLQKFNGGCYFTSLDLSSAFLQIQLHEDSRCYTAFLFDSTVYQFKRVPYGFRNSLPAFLRAIKLALGGGDLEIVVFYVDDLRMKDNYGQREVYRMTVGKV
jgi:hypothetical protein